MSADNVLATLQLTDGFRIADILMIWDGEEEQLFSSYNKSEFAQSEHYITEEDAETAVERILDQYHQRQRVLEYGTADYQLPMTWEEYLAASPNPRIECPVCQFPVKELVPIHNDDPDVQACPACINGTAFDP